MMSGQFWSRSHLGWNKQQFHCSQFDANFTKQTPVDSPCGASLSESVNLVFQVLALCVSFAFQSCLTVAIVALKRLSHVFLRALPTSLPQCWTQCPTCSDLPSSGREVFEDQELAPWWGEHLGPCRWPRARWTNSSRNLNGRVCVDE